MITYFCNLTTNPHPEHLLSSLCYQIAGRYQGISSSEQNPIDQDGPGSVSNLRDNSSNCEPTTSEPVSDFHFSTTPCQNPTGIIKPDLSKVKEHLSFLLFLTPSPTHPLVLILDGLDHTENSFGPQIIGSLPSNLPPNVKVILAVSSKRTQILQAIDSQRSPAKSGSEGGEEESGYVCVPLGSADRKQCVKMLESLLSSSGRRVTSGQQALVNQALTSCCLPLYARLLHLHTSLWHSGTTDTVWFIKDKSDDVFFTSLIQQIPWKDQNQWCIIACINIFWPPCPLCGEEVHARSW